MYDMHPFGVKIGQIRCNEVCSTVPGADPPGVAIPDLPYPTLSPTMGRTPTTPGKKFGDAADDWQFWHGKIPAVLRKWHERGYKVAIISNQMGVGTGKTDARMVRRSDA